MKSLITYVILVLASFSITSCYTYREVVSSNMESDQSKMEQIKKQLKPGDIVDLRVNNRMYYYNIVTKIKDPYLIVLTENSDMKYKDTYVRIDQIDELKLYAEYKEMGVPIVSVMVLFYIIAI